MIFRELTVEGYRRLGACKWAFGPGLNVVRGPNEAGKSTLQDALVTAMFGDVNTTAQAMRNRRAWGREEMFRLAVKAETAGGEAFELDKDFARKDGARVTFADGTVVEGRKKVAEQLEDLLGISSEAAYVSTACLRQGDFAGIQAGKELSALLQEAVTGGAEGVNPEAILKELDDRITKLEIGLKGQAKTPGPLQAKTAQVADLGQRLNEAKSRLAEREQAQETLDRCNREVERIAGELEKLQAVRDRVVKRRDAETKLEAAGKEASALQGTLNAAKQFSEGIAQLEQRLAASSPIDPAVLDGIAQKEQEAAIIEQQAARLAEEAEQAASCSVEPGQPGCEGKAGQLAEALTRAIDLQAKAGDTRNQATLAGADADRAQRALGAAMASRRRATLGTFAGVAIMLLGVVFGSVAHQVVLYVLAAVGAAVAIVSMFRMGQFRVIVAQADADAASIRRAEAEKAAREFGAQLEAVLSGAGAQSVNELNEASQKARDEEAANAQLLSDMAAKANAAQQQQAEAQDKAAQLRAQVAEDLKAVGFASIADMRAALERRQGIERELGEKRAGLEATLQGTTLAEVQALYSKAALSVDGIEETLKTPDMLSAQMTPEQYQDLVGRISRLQDEQERLQEARRDAQVTLRVATDDAEDVGVLEGQLVDAQADLERLTERRDVYTLTRDLLSEARQETMARASELVAPRASEHVMTMTFGRYRKIWLDEGTFEPHVSIPEQGEDTKCEIGQLSCATIEQIYLAIRLALTELLFGKEPLPILLDDPFVNFDSERREAALKLVKQLSGKHQILLFTCSEEYDTYADRVVPLEGVCSLT
jgi:DNA repair exonuclease SbcCD ATPase subunit